MPSSTALLRLLIGRKDLLLVFGLTASGCGGEASHQNLISQTGAGGTSVQVAAGGTSIGAGTDSADAACQGGSGGAADAADAAGMGDGQLDAYARLRSACGLMTSGARRAPSAGGGYMFK